jgi:hypothetical protein
VSASKQPSTASERLVPDWTPSLLLFVFATHLPFFLWRWKRTGESRYAATSLTFALLVVVYAFRVLAPQATIADVAVHRIVRGPALLSAVVSIGLLIRHHARRAARGPC